MISSGWPDCKSTVSIQLADYGAEPIDQLANQDERLPDPSGLIWDAASLDWLAVYFDLSDWLVLGFLLPCWLAGSLLLVD